MPYYPLSQIQTDLFTNGNEYIFKFNRKPYKGPYYKTSNGKLYSESIPNNQSKEIILIDQTSGQPIEEKQTFLEEPPSKIINIVNSFSTDDASLYDTKNNPIYTANISNYTSDAQSRVIPSPHYPVLSQEQKDSGQFTRYFTKKTNELRYIEIDKPTYDALKSRDNSIAWDLYEPASLIWRIKGDKQEIYTSNKGSALSIEQQFRWPGFSQYFKDKFTQFYQQPSTQENLYTSGGEFKTPDGKEYMGSYHIHPEKGAMVGAIHTKKKHDLLTPINPTLSTQITSSQPPSTPSINLGGGYTIVGGY